MKKRHLTQSHPVNSGYVLIVSTSFPISKGSTSGVFVKQLTDALSEHVDTSVLVPDGRRSNCTFSGKYPITCFRYAPKTWQGLAHEPGGIPAALNSNPAYWLIVPFFLLGLLFATARASAGCKLLHSNWSMTGLVCGLVARFRKIPSITTLRGSDVNKLDSSFLNQIILNHVLQLNDYVVTVSRPMQESLAKKYPDFAHKIIHIPNGVDDAFLYSPILPPSRTLRLIMIGNLIPGKGCHDVVRSLAKLSVPVSLSVVGDGQERNSLEKLATELRVNDRVAFLGIKPHSKIPAIVAEHDVLILASSSEGRPNVVVEAMASGKAVIATRLPGVCELIVDGVSGLLFEPGDINALATHISTLSKHPEFCTQLGIAARKAVSDMNLTWQATAIQYFDLYSNLWKKA